MKKLTGLCELLEPIDVLTKMFELDDEGFKTAARDLFKNKFSDDYVEDATFKPEPINAKPNDSLKLLNLFGDQIIKLKVKYDSSYRRTEKKKWTMPSTKTVTNHWKKSN